MVWRADARGTREVAKRNGTRMDRILTGLDLEFPFVDYSVKLPCIEVDGAWVMREPSYLCCFSGGPS